MPKEACFLINIIAKSGNSEKLSFQPAVFYFSIKPQKEFVSHSNGQIDFKSAYVCSLGDIASTVNKLNNI